MGVITEERKPGLIAIALFTSLLGVILGAVIALFDSTLSWSDKAGLFLGVFLIFSLVGPVLVVGHLLMLWLIDHTWLGRYQLWVMDVFLPWSRAMGVRKPMMWGQAHYLPRDEFQARRSAYRVRLAAVSERARSLGQGDPGQVILAAIGSNGVASLYADRVRIQRKGLKGLITHFEARQVEIPIQSIGSVRFSDAARSSSGYIQLVAADVTNTPNEVPRASGILRFYNKAFTELLLDEYTVFFKKSQQAEFEALRDAIEQRLVSR